MKIENKLTLAHIKLNKKRSALTILGIIISVAMIVSVFIGVASFLDYRERMVISNNDAAHIYIYNVDDERLEILRNDSRIKSVGLIENGTADTSGIRVKGADSLRLSTAFLERYNSDMFNQLYIEDMDGTFPKNRNEILINREYIDRNGFDWKIGDTITLQTGGRYKANSYVKLPNTGEYEYGEKFELYENRKFKLVGIINNKVLDYQINQMYTGCDEDSVYTAHVQLNKVTPFSMLTIKDIVQELGISPENKSINGYFTNDALLATHFCGSADSEMITKYIPMGAAILVIILIAAFMLIYNTFGMSIAERTRYLGMLSSVGATRKQKKKSSYFEGVVLGLIGIPLGAVLGILVTLIGVRLINNAGFTDISLKFVMPIWSIAVAVTVSILTIFVSLYAPVKKASQATAIEAIRQNNTIKIKKAGSPFSVKKLFGFEGVLAYKNLRRNGKRSRLITASIAISSILFLCVNYYCSLTTALVIDDLNKPYQVEFALAGYADREQVLKDIKSIDGVKDVYSIHQADAYNYGKANAESYYDTDQKITKENNTTNKYKNLWDDVSIIVNSIDDDDFNALCKNNGIDPKPYYEIKDKRWKCVVMNNIDHKENGDKIFNENIIGGVLTSNPYSDLEHEELRTEMGLDEMSKEEQDAYVQELINIQTFYDIADTVEYDENNYVCKLNPTRTISAYIPFSMDPIIADIFDEYDDDNPFNFSYGVETDNHEECSEDIGKYFDDHPEYANDSSTYVIDHYSYALDSIQFNKVIKIFMYAFIALITMITLANIINTITTSISSRKREFAMIKSVGITPQSFKKMIALESVFYGINSLLIAIPVSIGINLLLNKIVSDGKIPFEFNFIMYLIVIAAIVLFVGSIMLYSIRKIKNDNIIENIKNDIL